ncbi:MAG: rRNA maturation RNase YbeY [Urechidicola sp.]|nr:rRNA maturation RNase YbeY [Urechidicola sp.]
MIVFNKEIEFEFENTELISLWISQTIEKEGFKEGEVNYIFCSDEDLLEKNLKFLNHNTLTDIISFDYTLGSLISGDIFISIDRVTENATIFKSSFLDELHRVMIHGILHYCGYKDKTFSEKNEMRSKEEYYLSLRKI